MLGRKMLGGVSSVGLWKCDMIWTTDETVEETTDEWTFETISATDRFAGANIDIRKEFEWQFHKH